eukprot:ANDGO_07274.mRNA.1 hypothetical protein
MRGERIVHAPCDSHVGLFSEQDPVDGVDVVYVFQGKYGTKIVFRVKNGKDGSWVLHCPTMGWRTRIASPLANPFAQNEGIHDYFKRQWLKLLPFVARSFYTAANEHQESKNDDTNQRCEGSIRTVKVDMAKEGMTITTRKLNVVNALCHHIPIMFDTVARTMREAHEMHEISRDGAQYSRLHTQATQFQCSADKQMRNAGGRPVSAGPSGIRVEEVSDRAITQAEDTHQTQPGRKGAGKDVAVQASADKMMAHIRKWKECQIDDLQPTEREARTFAIEQEASLFRSSREATAFFSKLQNATKVWKKRNHLTQKQMALDLSVIDSCLKNTAVSEATLCGLLQGTYPSMTSAHAAILLVASRRMILDECWINDLP